MVFVAHRLKSDLADLNRQLDAERKRNGRKAVPEPIDLGPVGVPQMALTMAVSTRVSGQTPANWKAWYEQTQCPSRSFCTRWPIVGSSLTSAPGSAGR